MIDFGSLLVVNLNSILLLAFYMVPALNIKNFIYNVTWFIFIKLKIYITIVFLLFVVVLFPLVAQLTTLVEITPVEVFFLPKLLLNFFFSHEKLNFIILFNEDSVYLLTEHKYFDMLLYLIHWLILKII